MTRNVAIFIYDDVAILDFAGPYEVFSEVGRRSAEGEPPFNVYLVSEKQGSIRAGNNVIFEPHYTLADCPTPDILIVPGGGGAQREMNNPVILEWVTSQAAEVELLLSVCTGAFILAKAGLLDHQTATTHHLDYEMLEAMAPTTTVVRDVRYVDNGRIITSAGISAGIDMSLYVVARLLGEVAAAEVADYLEYPWEPVALDIG